MIFTIYVVAIAVIITFVTSYKKFKNKEKHTDKVLVLKLYSISTIPLFILDIVNSIRTHIVMKSDIKILAMSLLLSIVTMLIFVGLPWLIYYIIRKIRKKQ